LISLDPDASVVCAFRIAIPSIAVKRSLAVCSTITEVDTTSETASLALVGNGNAIFVVVANEPTTSATTSVVLAVTNTHPSKTLITSQTESTAFSSSSTFSPAASAASLGTLTIRVDGTRPATKKRNIGRVAVKSNQVRKTRIEVNSVGGLIVKGSSLEEQLTTVGKVVELLVLERDGKSSVMAGKTGNHGGGDSVNVNGVHISLLDTIDGVVAEVDIIPERGEASLNT